MVKKSISYWSFEGGLEGKKSIRECLSEAKQAGFDAVELALGETGELGLNVTESDCKKILDEAGKLKIEISSVATGLYWDYPLTDNDDKVAAKAKEITEKLLQVASWFKVDTVLVIPGAVDVFFKPDFKAMPYDTVYSRALKALKELSKTAEKLKVNIGIENVWNKFLLSPLEMSDFIDKVGSSHVGSYFDVGNVLLLGYPQHWIKILGKKIKRVHIKDFKKSFGTAEGFCDLLEGDVNWNEVMKAFSSIKYDGYITAEMIPYKPGLLEKTSAAMDKIFSMK